MVQDGQTEQPGIGRATELLREAVAAARAGEKRQARSTLQELLSIDPDNEQGLLWAAALSDSMDGAFWFLQRLLQVNPQNAQAANILSMHEARQATQEATGPDAAMVNAAVIEACAEARKAPPKPRWQCPLCLVEAVEPPRRCPRCCAIPTINDLRVIASNEGVDEKLLNEAVRDLSKRVTAEPSFEVYFTLGLALLNLKRSAEALGWLRKASETRPADRSVRMVVHLLEQRKLILVVDDSPTVRKVVSTILEQNGYRAITASDGMQALSRFNECTPDLILLDITMPRMDGYELCRVLKKNPYLHKIPILMLSGNDGLVSKVKSKLAGAADYLTKPLDEETLLDALNSYLLPAGTETTH